MNKYEQGIETFGVIVIGFGIGFVLFWTIVLLFSK